MQEEYVGAGSLSALSDILAKLSPQRIFLVTGRTSYATSGAEELITPLLRGHGTTFSEFSVNPTLADVEKGIALYAGARPDAVIAVGGGSAIDMAKCVNALASTADPAAYIRGEKTLEKAGVPLIAIPTTAGSGSEATHFAVCYIDGKKYSLTHDSLLPRYAIVDPRLSYQLPPKITAASGMDALCQGIESYWSVHSTKESKKYAKEAIELSYAHLRAAVRSEQTARDQMAKAAHLAGKAINISKTTASHAMSYPLTQQFDIPHGHAVALTIGAVFAFNAGTNSGNVADPRGAVYVQSTVREIATLLGADDVDSVRQAISTLMRDIGLERRLADFGVQDSDIPNLLAGVSTQRAGNNPRRFDLDSVETILTWIL